MGLQSTAAVWNVSAFWDFPVQHHKKENVSWNPTNQTWSKSRKCYLSVFWNYVYSKSVPHHVCVNALCSCPVIGGLATAHESKQSGRWMHICSYIHNTTHPCRESWRKSKRKHNWKQLFANLTHCANVEVTKSTKVTQRDRWGKTLRPSAYSLLTCGKKEAQEVICTVKKNPTVTLNSCFSSD